MIGIADTSFVVAVFDSQDKYHQASLALYRQYQKIFLPQTVLSEFGHIIGRDFGNIKVAEFLLGIKKSRYEMIVLNEDDIQRVGQMLAQYADTRLDFVDASVMALAKRLKLQQILTLDRRDFSLVRPQHVPYFELLPPLEV